MDLLESLKATKQMISFKTLTRLVWAAVIAAGFSSCDQAAKQEITPDSSRMSSNAKRGDRKDSPSSRSRFESEMEAVEAMDDPAKKNEALAVLAKNAMGNRPDLARIAILKLPADSPELPGLLAEYLTSLLASGSADAALAWADSLEDGEMSRMARELLADLVPDEQLGTTVPRALDAGKIAGKGFNPGDEVMLQRWAMVDPRAAAAWLGNMPVGETRNEGFRNITRSLVLVGDAPASNWLKSLPTEKLRADAKEAMATALMETPDPIRMALLGPPESELRIQLGEALARLQPPPEPVPAELQPTEDPAPDQPESTE